MRINVFEYSDNPDEPFEPQFAGWFNQESATQWKENTDWDDTATHQELYRTAKGRWVRCDWTQYQDSEPKYWFVSDAEAHRWLLINRHDDAVQKHFGEAEEEAGPRLGGRPKIGPKVDTNIDKETLRRVMKFANGRPRADALRELITAGLDALEAV